MPRRIANVWAAACPKCHAQTDAPCVDLSGGPYRTLFGRRTHQERAKAVKALPTTSYTTGVLNGTITAGSITINNTNGTAINFDNAIYHSNTAITNATLTANSIRIEPDAVWQDWVNVGTTTQTFYYQPVWEAWIEDDEQRAAHETELIRQRDELQARREQQNRERLAREQERMENQLVAHARALELLDDLLTEEERELRRQENRLAVRGSDGHLYWIEMHNESVHGNIVRTDEHGCRLGRACVAPRMYDGSGVLPTPDGWVGQYLGLKFDAEEFLSYANWSGMRACEHPAEYVIEAA